MADPHLVELKITAGGDIAARELAATRASLQQLGQQVTQLNAQMASGTVGARTYELRLGQIRGEVARLGKQSAQLSGVELKGFEGLLAQTEVTAGHASGGLRMVKSSLASLAFGLTGTEGPLGKLGEGIALLGIGSLPVIGALAGVAAIAGVFRLLTKDEREQKKATDDAIDSLLKLRETSRFKGAKESEELASARQHLATVTTDLANTEADLAKVRQQLFQGGGGDPDRLLQEQHFLEVRLAKLKDDQQRTLLATNTPQLVANRQAYLDDQKRLHDTFVKLNADYFDAVVRVQALAAGHKSAEAAIERLRLQAEGFTGAELNAAMATWTHTQALIAQEKALTARNAAVAALVATATSNLAGLTEFNKELRAMVGMPGGPESAAEGAALLTTEEQGIAGRTGATSAPRVHGNARTATRVTAAPMAMDTAGAAKMADLVGAIASGFGVAGENALRLNDQVSSLVGVAFTFGHALGDSFVNAIAASKNLGKSLKEGTLSALRDVAMQKAKYYAGEALGALAGAFFPKFNPAGLFAFGKYMAAAAVMGSIAGGIGGSGAGGGSGGSTATAGGAAAASPSLADQRPIVNVYLVGQTTKQLVPSLAYESARYRQLGGRAGGVGQSTTEVTVPGAVVIKAG